MKTSGIWWLVAAMQVVGASCEMSVLVLAHPPHCPSDRQRAAAEELGQPMTIVNSIGVQMVLIPAGDFAMGGAESPEELAQAFPDAERGWFHREHPQHKVRITRPFYIGVTEVTQAQYEQMVRKNPSSLSGLGRPTDELKGLETSSFPSVNVSWDEAVQFCRELSAKEGHSYRLPTEAQWEYACRAGSTTRYCFGDDESQLTEYTWYIGNSDYRTHPVGGRNPNIWGLYDIHGNVWEWCSDWYEADYYSKSPTDDPTGPVRGAMRVCRGGGAAYFSWRCQSSSRCGRRPSSSSDFVGFRVTRDVVLPKNSIRGMYQPKGHTSN